MRKQFIVPLTAIALFILTIVALGINSTKSVVHAQSTQIHEAIGATDTDKETNDDSVIEANKINGEKEDKDAPTDSHNTYETNDQGEGE